MHIASVSVTATRIKWSCYSRKDRTPADGTAPSGETITIGKQSSEFNSRTSRFRNKISLMLFVHLHLLSYQSQLFKLQI